jgi:hypothetical protein
MASSGNYMDESDESNSLKCLFEHIYNKIATTAHAISDVIEFNNSR